MKGKRKRESEELRSTDYCGERCVCSNKFYKNICSGIEGDDFLLFNDTLPSTTLKKIYVREAYKTIASSIVDNISKAIITGSPGIGKTLFLMYLLWKLVQKGKRVLFIYHPNMIYYDESGKVFNQIKLPSPANEQFWGDDLYCLFDSKLKSEPDLRPFPYDECRFILVTSPRRSMINDFKKPPPPKKFYMPIWDEKELKFIAEFFPENQNWYKRFKALGGVPRFVLEDKETEETELLLKACKECSLDDCIKLIGSNIEITEKSKVIHALVHVTSVSPYRDPTIKFASYTALNIFAKEKGNEAKRRMRFLLASCEDEPLTATLCGHIFEKYAIELLEKGGKFTYHELQHGNKKEQPKDEILRVMASRRQVVDKVLTEHKEQQLYVPATKNYSAIDAWIPGIGAFQMTISKKHDVKDTAMKDLKILGNKFYWLVPPCNYHCFTKQTKLGIEQYVVRIPYPPVLKEVKKSL